MNASNENFDKDENAKLQKFASAVDEKINEQIELLLDNAKNEENEIIEQAKESAKIETHHTVNRELAAIESKYKKMKAQAVQDSKTELLLHRKMLSQTIQDNVKEQLLKFTAAEQYPDCLLGMLENESLPESAVIKLRPQDMQHSDYIRKRLNKNYQIQADESIKLGGLIVFDPDSSTIDDRTFDYALEQQRNSFCQRYSFLGCL